MAYVPRFEHDIFISYSHLNNYKKGSGEEGWVSRFHRCLEDELKELIGKELKIWRDPRLEGNQLFDQTIKQAVESSALFLAINSLAYKESDYCQQEVAWFCDQAQKGSWRLSLGDRKRIFNLRYNNIPFAEWHPALSGTTGYPFYEDDPIKEVGFPYAIESSFFKDQLKLLVSDLWKTLHTFKKAALNKEATDAVPDKPNDGKPGTAPAPMSDAVLLDTHMKDDDHAVEVRNALHSLNVKAVFNQSEDDPGESIKILESRLKQFRRMIIVFGNVNESWVFGRLSMASEIANKEKAALKLGIYYAPQRRKGNGGQIRFGSLTVHELDDTDLRNPQALLPLLS